MTIDSGARKRAAKAKKLVMTTNSALPLYSTRDTIAIGVIGQSNERGNVLDTVYPQAWGSLINLADRVPIGPAVSNTGGWWHYVQDDLRSWGYNSLIVNGAIGSLSFVQQACGQMTFRNNNGTYYQQRTPQSTSWGDRGDMGDLICPNGNKVYRCTTGRLASAIGTGPAKAPASNATYLDYMQYQGSLLTASSSPDFTTPSVLGTTVSDGGVTWTLESLTAGVYGGVGGTVFSESQAGLGWDRYGVLQRLHEEMQRIRGASRKIIYIQNAQSDLSATQSWYQAALTNITNFYLARGYEVMIGLSCYQPTTDNTAAYNTLSAARTAALTTLQAGQYGSKVYPGANLYTSMGTTGPMAQGGAFMQGDNVHLNSAGAVGPAVNGVYCAGKYVSDSFKAILPKRTVIN